MRCLPVALATLGQSAAQVRAACVAQSHVTHNNAVSDAAVELVVSMVQRSLAGGGLRELLRECVRPCVAAYPVFRFRTRHEANPSGYIVDTIRAVLQALFETDSFESCMIDIVNRGGDADTTGAIAGMLAGALYGSAAVPARWANALDPALQGACRQQALALIGLARTGAGRVPDRGAGNASVLSVRLGAVSAGNVHTPRRALR
jgi:ADP-ribosyl-[dinitrogen reductase] hydrolase